MESITSQRILEALNWRYAVKKFDSTKKISDPDWQTLQEVLRLTPSSYGLQPWKFIWVRNPAMLGELRAVSRNQAQVTDCSHYLVITHLEKIDEHQVDRHLAQMAKVREVEISTLAPLRKSMVEGLLQGRRSHQLDRWAERQAFIALGQVMTAAALLQIDTCPMEGIEPDRYDEILGIKGSGYKTLATLAFGYRSNDDKYAKMKKVRFDSADLFETR